MKAFSEEEGSMEAKPSYEELVQRVKQLEKEFLEHNQVEQELLFKGTIISSL